MIFFQQLPGFYNQVGLRITWNGLPAELNADSSIFSTGMGNGFEDVVNSDWEENSFQVMIAIGSFAQDAQAEVDLAIGKVDHAGYFFFLRLLISSRMVIARI